MNNLPHSDLKYVALKPDLRSTSYRVQTNWHVIAGAPSAGKSTLIEDLSNQGFNTAPEPARLYMDHEFAKGRTIQEIRKDRKKLQHTFLGLQLNLECQLDPDEFIFLDRGIPDQFTYCRIAGVNPNKFLDQIFHFRYASVFILAPLPFKKDGYRDPEADIIDYFDEQITRDYLALGYHPIRVPVLSPAERLAFVMERLKL